MVSFMTSYLTLLTSWYFYLVTADVSTTRQTAFCGTKLSKVLSQYCLAYYSPGKKISTLFAVQIKYSETNFQLMVNDRFLSNILLDLELRTLSKKGFISLLFCTHIDHCKYKLYCWFVLFVVYLNERERRPRFSADYGENEREYDIT